MKKHFAFIYFIILSVLFTAYRSFALDLSVPISCLYGTDCFIESYFDHNPAEGESEDHTCGKLTYDGHKSTDFKLRDHVLMVDGVTVVAGDSGVVSYVRDGMSDISVDLIGKEAVRGRECGNGVIIEHKRGYETQYCHLKRNSLLVKKGDIVDKGQPIGEVGLSGFTSFPYLEFTVKLNGDAVDPFTGEDPVTGSHDVSCDSLDTYPIWDKQAEKKLKYISTALLGMGFSKKVPYARGAREGKFGKDQIDNDARLLVLWVDVFGVVKGDEMKMTILSPDGKTLSTEIRKFNNDKRHVFQFLGKKADSNIWPTGEYIGKIELMRKENNEIYTVINSSSVVEIVDPALKEKEVESK